MNYRYDGRVTDERMEVYLETLSHSVPEYIERLAAYASEAHVPVMRRQTGELLRFIINSNNITNILEVGTAIGYSALYMAECGKALKIDTIEKVPARIGQAADNFSAYDKDGRITLYPGDAKEVLDMLISDKRLYELVFLDAAKAQYSVYMGKIYGLLAKGGIVVTDNVLQEGELLESRYAVNRRDRTIHSRMREFLYDITHSDRWDTIVLPIGDGVAISVRQ